MKTFALLFVAAATFAQTADPQVTVQRLTPAACALLTSYAKVPCAPVIYVAAASAAPTKYFEVTVTYKPKPESGESITRSLVAPALPVAGAVVGVAAFDDPGGQIVVSVTTLSPGKSTTIQ